MNNCNDKLISKNKMYNISNHLSSCNINHVSYFIIYNCHILYAIVLIYVIIPHDYDVS